MSDIYRAITDELEHQEEHWSVNQYTLMEWIVFMQSRLDQAKGYLVLQPGLTGREPIAKMFVLRAVAMGVACLEQHDLVTREDLGL